MRGPPELVFFAEASRRCSSSIIRAKPPPPLHSRLGQWPLLLRPSNSDRIKLDRAWRFSFPMAGYPEEEAPTPENRPKGTALGREAATGRCRGGEGGGGKEAAIVFSRFDSSLTDD